MELKDKINKFPQKTGIYMMKDKEGNIIYVGKSKKLRDRVKSYFVKSANHSRKNQRLVKNICDIDIIITDTELDALLLECEMIKKIRPIYNVLMKNHENYTYIKINVKQEFPSIEVVREIEDDNMYFGPYTMERKLEEVKNIIAEIYKVRLCKKQTKCMKYDLNKCLGPCRDITSKEEYNKSVQKVISTLRGEDNEIINILESKMQEEISTLNFEKACEIKGSIDLVKSIMSKQYMINNINKQETILAWINIESNEYKIYLIKGGKVIDSKKIRINKISDEEIKEEILKIYKDLLNNKNDTCKILDKEDIDYINIIHSYIKYNKSIKSVILKKNEI